MNHPSSVPSLDTSVQTLPCDVGVGPTLPDYDWVNVPEQCRSRIKALAQRAYPEYRGRKFELRFQKSYYFQNYWDGGTKYYAKWVDLLTDRITSPPVSTTSPFYACANATVDIPPGFAILEKAIVQGHGLGVTLILAPLTLVRKGA